MKLFRLSGVAAIFALTVLFPVDGWSQETSNGDNAADKAPVAVNALLGNQNEIKRIKQKAVEAKATIKQETQSVEVLKREADRVLEEKKLLAKDVQLKEKEAALAKQEFALVIETAQVSGDMLAAHRAGELEQRAKQLDEEALAQKNRLSQAEERARLAQNAVGQAVLAIESLNQEVAALKREKNRKKGWVPKLAVAGGIVLFGLLLLLLLSRGVRQFECVITEKDAIRENETTLRLKTLSSLFKWVGSIVIVCVVIYMILDNFGIDMAPILAGAGILGLALGFGGQYLIRDIINGVFILIEGQYRINDVIKVGEHAGLVEQVNLRYTRLRDMEGRVIYIPNGKVETVINFTQEFAQAVLQIGVAYKENVDQVMVVLSEIGAEMRQDEYFGQLILDDMEMLGVDDFADSQVTIKCRMKTLPIKQWQVAREFRRRVKNKFDELDIEIPFPHRTVYEGKQKDMEKLEAWREQQKEKRADKFKQDHAGEARR